MYVGCPSTNFGILKALRGARIVQGGGCFSFECTALWRVYIYCVWLYLGSREYRLLDQTLRE